MKGDERSDSGSAALQTDKAQSVLKRCSENVKHDSYVECQSQISPGHCGVYMCKVSLRKENAKLRVDDAHDLELTDGDTVAHQSRLPISTARVRSYDGRRKVRDIELS